MPDLDELLAADAHASATADGGPSAFAPAFDRTMTRVRRRRVGAVLASGAVAAALTGGVIVSATGSSDPTPQRVRLAAYEHAIGAVPGLPDYSYVVAPAAGRLAHRCRVVPGSRVTVHTAPEGAGRTSVTGGSALVTFGSAGHHLSPEIRQLFVTIAVAEHGVGKYSLFTCRTG